MAAGRVQYGSRASAVWQLTGTGSVINFFRSFPQFLNLYSVNSMKVLSAVKPKVQLNDTNKFSPYRAVNTLRICYTDQSVNAV
jgi:hypothetical protein